MRALPRKVHVTQLLKKQQVGNLLLHLESPISTLFRSASAFNKSRTSPRNILNHLSLSLAILRNNISNMPTISAILTGLAGVLAVLGLAVYLFGIPPEMKRKMEKAALKTMGENKASYMMKGKSCHSVREFCMTLLTYIRPNLQDSSLRPKRCKRSQEHTGQHRWWSHAESHW